MKPVKAIMSRDVLTVHSKQKLSEVSALFKAHNIHHVPVVSGNTPVGMIAATDLYKLIFDIETTDDRMVDAMLDHQFSIEQVMRKDLVTLPTTASIKEAAGLLSNGKFHSVAILDEQGELAGLVTSTDLISYLHDSL